MRKGKTKFGKRVHAWEEESDRAGCFYELCTNWLLDTDEIKFVPATEPITCKLCLAKMGGR